MVEEYLYICSCYLSLSNVSLHCKWLHRSQRVSSFVARTVIGTSYPNDNDGVKSITHTEDGATVEDSMISSTHTTTEQLVTSHASSITTVAHRGNANGTSDSMVIASNRMHSESLVSTLSHFELEENRLENIIYQYMYLWRRLIRYVVWCY